MEATSLTETILNIIPDNPFKSLASGDNASGHRICTDRRCYPCENLVTRAETVANFFSQFNDIMMEMTMMVMSLAPIGVFCLISRTFATYRIQCICSAGKIHDRSAFGTCDPVSWQYIRFC